MAERVMWVPTGEVRHPRLGEHFAPGSVVCDTPDRCGVHVRCVDGAVAEKCYVTEYDQEREIYERVTVRTED